MADGVDATVDDVQPSGVHAAVDRACGQPKGAQLAARDDAVLAAGERGDGPV